MTERIDLSNVPADQVADAAYLVIMNSTAITDAVHEAHEAITAAEQTVTIKVADLEHVITSGLHLVEDVLDGDYDSRSALASAVELPFRDLRELIENATQ